MHEQKLRLGVGSAGDPRSAGSQLTYVGAVFVEQGLCPVTCPGEAPIKMMRAQEDCGGFGHSDFLHDGQSFPSSESNISPLEPSPRPTPFLRPTQK
jgi:hypothetical protein